VVTWNGYNNEKSLLECVLLPVSLYDIIPGWNLKTNECYYISYVISIEKFIQGFKKEAYTYISSNNT
jgi:hypothetical protein